MHVRCSLCDIAWDSQSAITAGDFGLLISYALNVTQLLNISVILSSQVEAYMNSVERVQHYSVPRDQEKWEAADKRLSESVQGGQWPSKGRVEIRDLQMRYRDDLDLVLKHINLTFPAGARVGVVGRTGSGKSSLLVALFRMVEPCGGDILVDGVSLRQLSLEDVRTHLSILPQVKSPIRMSSWTGCGVTRCSRRVAHVLSYPSLLFALTLL